MNIILFGPPGAGKGTQAHNLVKFLKLHKISTGDLLRREIKNNTILGVEIKSILEKGSLVLLHGRLPHYSCENKSNKSRHAYTLHVIDGNCKYPDFNWLQRSRSMPLKGFLD